MQNVRVGDKGGMAEMNKHIGVIEHVKGEVTGAITGIAADNDRETLAGKGIGDLCCLSFEPGRKLEGY
jgi:hypothetical protein